MVSVFVLFKQKTAYERRISDWSSDVCSSDLGEASAAGRRRRTFAPKGIRTRRPAVLRTKRFSLSREKNQEKAAISRLFPLRHGRRRLRQTGLLHHFGGVVLDHLLDAFADCQALEAHDVRPGGLAHGLHPPVGTDALVSAVA